MTGSYIQADFEYVAESEIKTYIIVETQPAKEICTS